MATNTLQVYSCCSFPVQNQVQNILGKCCWVLLFAQHDSSICKEKESSTQVWVMGSSTKTILFLNFGYFTPLPYTICISLCMWAHKTRNPKPIYLYLHNIYLFWEGCRYQKVFNSCTDIELRCYTYATLWPS